MDRRAFIGTLASSLLAAPLAAGAQQVKTSRSDVLTAGSTEPLRQSLRELGYVEGQNVAIDLRQTDGTPERLDEFAFELARLKVDAIVATYPAAAFRARRASATIPIKEAVPRAARIAVLWNPDNPWHPVTVKGLQGRGRSSGVQPQFLPVRGPTNSTKHTRRCSRNVPRPSWSSLTR
jgi:hypothetical protein